MSHGARSAREDYLDRLRQSNGMHLWISRFLQEVAAAAGDFV